MKLKADLIPKTSFFTNVRSILPEKWDEIRKKCYKNANYKCEICFGKGKRWPVECHEVWSYKKSKKKNIQKLEKLIALCPECHQVNHAGLATIRGKIDEVYDQLVKVNNITYEEAKLHIKQAFDIWRDRSLCEWELDISFLDTYLDDKDEANG